MIGAAQLNVSTWFRPAVVSNFSQKARKMWKSCSMFSSKLGFMGNQHMLLCRDRGEGRVAGLGVIWPGFFFLKSWKEGGGGRWSRGRIGKVQAHRFKEDPDVCCCIWTAAFGT